MDGSSFSLGADIPDEKRKRAESHQCRRLRGHEEEEEETDRRSDAAPAADAQLVAETENMRAKLSAALARNNKFEPRAEEDRMENERLASEKRQNQDLARAHDELIRVKNEPAGHNHELKREKDDLVRGKEAWIREKEELGGQRYNLIRGKDELTKPNDELTKEKEN
jgi:hypothetical protein